MVQSPLAPWKFNSSPLKISRAPKKKPNHHLPFRSFFTVDLLNSGGGGKAHSAFFLDSIFRAAAYNLSDASCKLNHDNDSGRDGGLWNCQGRLVIDP